MLTAVTSGLWVFILLTEIGGEYEAFAKRSLFGIMTVHIAITLAVGVLYVAVDGGYLWKIASKPAFSIAMLCLLQVALIGLVRNGNTLLFREECYAIRWFVVGFMLMRIAITQKALKFLLAVATASTTILLFLIAEKATSAVFADTAIRRVISSNLWPVAYCGFVSVGLLLSATWPRGLLWRVGGLASLATMVVVGSVRTSTRSLFAVQALLLVLVLLALSRDPRMVARRKWFNRLQIVGVATILLYLTWETVTGKMFGAISMISRRFMGDEGTGAMRLKELEDMFASFGPIDWLFGGGLGSYFVTELGWWTARPHIAYFTWLQKGGLLLFVLATVLIYVRTSWSFFSTLLTKAPCGVPRLAGIPKPILVIGPSLIAWFATTFISGGFDNGSMLALGGLTALWIELEDEQRALRPGRAAQTT